MFDISIGSNGGSKGSYGCSYRSGDIDGERDVRVAMITAGFEESCYRGADIQISEGQGIRARAIRGSSRLGCTGRRVRLFARYTTLL